MRVKVGDVRLFVETVGTKLRIEDGRVAEKPTIVFVHGGPAWDHLTLRLDLEPLADVAQLIFYDHRGLGRSDRSDRSHWTLAQWATDLHRLIETLGLERPIVFGQSFGGMVAQRFAIDHPQDYAALILSATVARFDLAEVVETFRGLGGDDLARAARSLFTGTNPADRDIFLHQGFPHYTVRQSRIGALSPFEPHVLDHFFSDAGDGRRFDHHADLARVTTPTLVIGGDRDPVTSEAGVRALAAAFAPGIARLEIFANCGHGAARDCPEAALALLRGFVADVVARNKGR